MAWEARGARKYYYQSRRTRDGRVRKLYRGCGALAELTASLDAAAQAERKLTVEAWKQQKWQEKAVEAGLKDFGHECEILVQAALIAAGYHEHRGQWRRRRDS